MQISRSGRFQVRLNNVFGITHFAFAMGGDARKGLSKGLSKGLGEDKAQGGGGGGDGGGGGGIVGHFEGLDKLTRY